MRNRISIDNGFPGDGTLKLYITPPELGALLESDLNAAGVENGRLLEHSDTARDLLALAVGFTGAGGIKQIAHLLEVFCHRNDGKQITVRSGEEEISTTGLSTSTFKRILQARVDKQQLIDERWQKFVAPESGPSGTPDPSGAGPGGDDAIPIPDQDQD